MAEARALPNMTPWETYTIEKLDMQLYLNQQELDQALPRLHAMVETGVMPQEDKEAYFRIAMLLASNEQDYAHVIAYGIEALDYPDWDDQADEVLGTAYYFSGDLAGAEQFTQSVIARKEAAGERASLQTLNVLYNSQQDQGKEEVAIQTAGLIAVVDPTPENWGRVIDYAFSSANLVDHQYLNLYRLRRETNSLAPADYPGMANMAVEMGLPAEAQSVLNEAIATGNLQAGEIAEAVADVSALTSETEASLAGFASEAAASPDGQVEVQYGELLLGYERFAEAEGAIRRGIEKGGMANPADARVLLGIALLEQGKKPEAQQAFSEAEQNPTTQPVAWAWGLYASM
ncbi:MAG: hypothetical protein O7H40_13820 [Gammaproteobacteria bacterium]|nr:hypothetical protein [Gammaproteobacteria bacterium]